MTADSPALRSLARSPLVATCVVVLIVLVSVVSIWMSIGDILDHRRDLADAQILLDQMRARRGGPPVAGTSAVRSGSPFLEGPTVTVAGASLLQRVSGAIAQAGGTMQSSQVDVGGAQGKDGVVALLVSCEVEQTSLQKLLYDLEAGMPYLYVDQLDVQMPQVSASGEGPAGRLKVILGVSGRWQLKS